MSSNPRCPPLDNSPLGVPQIQRDNTRSRRYDGWRCSHCGERRSIIHPELDLLSTAHIDCDAFYATVEKRDSPELSNRPVIVGGSHRGVVAACCYIARLSGVRSAMPMFKALKLCPDAVVIPPNMAK